MIKRGAAIAVILALLFTMMACTRKPNPNDKTNQTATSGQTAEPTNVQATATPEPTAEPTKFAGPATGARPYAVMVDNEGYNCLPQGGLDKALLIYEAMVEGGETRLMPVFWDTKFDLVGPIRSARPYFIDFAMEYDAIYVHDGGSPEAKSDIVKFGINEVTADDNKWVMKKLTNNPKNWQDTFAKMADIIKYSTKDKGFNQYTNKGFPFEFNKKDTELAAGSKAEKVSIRYSRLYNCSFIYDRENKIYHRFRKLDKHMERSTNLQLTAKNIIIQEMKTNTIAGDKAGRQKMQTLLGGKGWYITDGKSVPIKWSKKDRKAPTQYVDEKGKPIILNPGQTWIQIVPHYETKNLKIE